MLIALSGEVRRSPAATSASIEPAPSDPSVRVRIA
jgi:hypothetical protein